MTVTVNLSLLSTYYMLGAMLGALEVWGFYSVQPFLAAFSVALYSSAPLLLPSEPIHKLFSVENPVLTSLLECQGETG